MLNILHGTKEPAMATDQHSAIVQCTSDRHHCRSADLGNAVACGLTAVDDGLQITCEEREQVVLPLACH